MVPHLTCLSCFASSVLSNRLISSSIWHSLWGEGWEIGETGEILGQTSAFWWCFGSGCWETSRFGRWAFCLGWLQPQLTFFIPRAFILLKPADFITSQISLLWYIWLFFIVIYWQPSGYVEILINYSRLEMHFSIARHIQ